MIKSFKHKGLEKFYLKGSTQGIQASHAKKIKLRFVALDTAQEIADMDLPGYSLHLLKGSRNEEWSISVSGNWRLTFKFYGGNVEILNYEDYH